MSSYIHNILLTLVTCFFLWIIIHCVFWHRETFIFKKKKKKGPSPEMIRAMQEKMRKAREAYLKKMREEQNRRQNFMADIAKTNDMSYYESFQSRNKTIEPFSNERPLVQISTVPFAQANRTIDIGLTQDNNKKRNIAGVRKIRDINLITTGKIIGMKVPKNMKVTIYEGVNFTGHSNSVTGEKLIDDFKYASTLLDYPEEEDENGQPMIWSGELRGWESRIRSFKIHRWVDIPSEFDSAYYTRTYRINDYSRLKQIEDAKPEESRDYSSIGEIVRNKQWQHFLDVGEKRKFSINSSGQPYTVEKGGGLGGGSSFGKDGSKGEEGNLDGGGFDF